MILTIDTCTAAVYVLSFITRDLSFTEIRYLAGDLRNVALSFLGTTDTDQSITCYHTYVD